MVGETVGFTVRADERELRRRIADGEIERGGCRRDDCGCEQRNQEEDARTEGSRMHGREPSRPDRRVYAALRSSTTTATEST